ncbi:choline dehydrogenase-like flavoprotein [Xanthobacter sp. SG618]|uniref:GMC oxidoreductase n=1 Tax=Xanthobacter sp. SG618 TaxID=2587121 RepID=UPI00145DF24E|nr:GMC oxidoreductase [Xanthobacter sp. SG618]NMN60002.1 choline dehydrogenase-like flavoprotein [Xanthobacter sp. SG618]
MFVSLGQLSGLPPHDVCVVGSGPVGIAVALACEEAGLSVLLLEAGQEQPDAFAAGLGAGHKVDEQRHAPTDIAMCRALGGTSRWWGGRCVPFDDIDFAHRPPVPDAVWPIRHAEIETYYARAAAYFGIGPARFTAPSAVGSLGDVEFQRLERWTPQINMGVLHRRRLETSRRITVVLGAAVTAVHLDANERRVESLTVGGALGSLRITPPLTVLACGGLETARLLLVSQRSHPRAFGGIGGPLGRTYMGHISGKIAEIVLADPTSVADHDFFQDEGAYVRRRLNLSGETQMREGVLNTAFWIDNPPFHQHEHGNGVLSLVWCALAFAPVGRRLASEGVRVAHVGGQPRHWGRHVRNVLRSPFGTLSGILKILRARFLTKPRQPGFIVRNRAGRYSLHYHGEHAPHSASRVVLSDRCDALGMPYLDVDLRFAHGDAESVVRSHELLDAALQRGGVGQLIYRQADREARLAAVLDQAADGFHQAGTTRMAATPSEGVVDAQCRIYGVDNLFVAGSSVLPSSGQANPTFIAVALGLRLADHLAGLKRAGTDVTAEPSSSLLHEGARA